mgnify:CR=1 FL=1
MSTWVASVTVHASDAVAPGAMLAGDGFRVAVAGMAGAKSSEGAKVAEYLHKDLKDFPGLSGPISFDAKGDREGEVYRVYKVDAEGKFVMQKL